MNWRVVEGYGATVARHGEGVPVAFDAPVRRIDHSGKRLTIETAKGTITADRVIVTLPTTVLAEMEDLFAPALPEKIEAARNLPLGLDDKLFIALDRPEEFEKDSRLFGAKDDSKTAAYHIRPFGRPMIEGFFGGANARELEAAGEGAFFDFAVAGIVRNSRRRLRQAAQADRHPPLGRRSVRPRRLFICGAGQGRLPRRARRAGR